MNVETKTTPAAGRKLADWLARLGPLLVVAVGFTTCSEGSRINAERDVRLAARGDAMHSGVEVVLPEADGQLRRRSAADPAVQALRAAPRLPDGEGVAGGSGRFDARWQARTLPGGVQEISVIWDNGDQGYVYVYRNEGGRLVSVSSRASHVGYMFEALPWALGAMLVTGVLCGALVWRLRRGRAGQAATG